MRFVPPYSKTLPSKPYLRDEKREPYLRLTPPPEPKQLVPTVPESIRDMHCHVIGKTGQGKTTLLAYQALRDIGSNKGGVCIIDPKGGVDGFVDIVARFIPENRLDDCIWLDMNDLIPLDVISCPKGSEDAVVRDLSYILTRGELDKGNAPDLSKNIDNLLYTLINANQNPKLPAEKRCTFLDIYRFFREPERQKEILKFVSDPALRTEWSAQFFPNPQAITRITTRINEYARSVALQTILGEPKPALNIQQVVDEGKVLLVTVPDENPSSSLYGSLLVAKIQQAAFSRGSTRKARSSAPLKPFFLYIDEFEYFRASKEFRKMLKMARSFKLCLTLANLELEELDHEVASALGTVSSFIILKINARDKHAFADIIGVHDPGETLRDHERSALHEWNATQSDASLRKLKIFQERLKDYPDKIITVEDAIKLKRYEAIYVFGDAPPIKRPTPQQPPQPTPQQLDNIEKIKKNTLERYGPTDANYARIIQKLTGDNASSNSPPVPHTEGNGTTIDYDNPQSGGSTDTILPSDQSKTRKP